MRGMSKLWVLLSLLVVDLVVVDLAAGPLWWAALGGLAAVLVPYTAIRLLWPLREKANR